MSHCFKSVTYCFPSVNDQSRQPPGIAHEAEVHRVFQHLFMHPVNEAMADIDLNGGKIPLELFQARRQLVQEDAVADASSTPPPMVSPTSCTRRTASA